MLLGLLLIWFSIFLIRQTPLHQPVNAYLKLWTVLEDEASFTKLVQKFAAQNNVRVQTRNFTDLENYQQTLLLELAAGTGPDIVYLHYTWLPKYQKLLTPLPTQQLGYTANNVATDFLDAVGSSVLFPTEQTQNRQTATESEPFEILALPSYVDSLALFYYKPLFREVLAKPYALPGATWTEVQNDAIALTIRDPDSPNYFQRSGLAIGRTDNITQGRNLLLNLYLQLGGEDLMAFQQESRLNQKNQKFNPLSAALDFGTSFTRNPRQKEFLWHAELAQTPAKEITEFARGKVAMIAGDSTYLTKIQNAITELKQTNIATIDFAEVEIAPLPQFNDPTKAGRQIVLADFFALAVPKNSKNPIYAWQLILDLTSAAAQTEYHKKTRRPASRRALITEQKQEKLTGVFAHQAVFAKSLYLTDFEKAFASLDQAINQIADGQLTISSALNFLQKEFSKL